MICLLVFVVSLLKALGNGLCISVLMMFLWIWCKWNWMLICQSLHVCHKCHHLSIFFFLSNYLLWWILVIFFSCDQAALWMVQFVCLSVTPFSLCSHHRIIMKFIKVITNDGSDVYEKTQGQRSKVKVTEVTTQLNRFQTVTPVLIHKWWWNDA